MGRKPRTYQGSKRKRKSKTYKKYGWANRKTKSLKKQKKTNIGISSSRGRHKVFWDD